MWIILSALLQQQQNAHNTERDATNGVYTTCYIIVKLKIYAA